MNMSTYDKSQPGNFYAVGVGPGAADLVTLRAANLIRSADVIIAPRSRMTEESLALKTVEDLIDGQEVIDHVYAMQRDIDQTMELWREVTEDVCRRLQQGQSVVQITIGDPLIYSTSCYLLSLLQERLPSEQIHVVPGISAFQSVASRFGEALTIQEDRLLIMPATNLAQVEEALEHCETLVLYKAGKQVAALADLLDRKGLTDRARLVCYVEQPGKEFATTDLRQAADGRHGYMATVIIHIDRQEWKTSNP